MNTPKFFSRKTPKKHQEQANDKEVSFGKIFVPILIFVFVIVVLGYIGFKSLGTYQYVASHWQEFVFAYTKPELVKAVRMQYEHKQAALDQEFLTGKPFDQELKTQVKETVKQELEARAAQQQPKQTYSAFK